MTIRFRQLAHVGMQFVPRRVDLIFFAAALVFCVQQQQVWVAAQDWTNDCKSTADVRQACDEQTAPQNFFIFCCGRIIEAVNVHKIFNDSKDFVDSPLKDTPENVRAAFIQQFNTQKAQDIDHQKLTTFVQQYFDTPGTELQQCNLSDWVPTPPALSTIKDSQLKTFALNVHGIWPKLCRQMHASLNASDGRNTLLYVPNEFIAPGGRFRELYYWDTFWIVKGLLASGMTSTAAGVLYNFKTLIDRLGFIPNGARIYYSKRSQPPVFAAMVYEFYLTTGNLSVVTDLLPSIEKELKFFQDQRSIVVNGSQVFQWHADSNVQRPESYGPDTTASQNPALQQSKSDYWLNMASGAESGMDYGSRWIRPDSNGSYPIYNVYTTEFVPVDLSAWICYAHEIAALLYNIQGNTDSSSKHRSSALSLRQSIDAVFWNDTEGFYFDYDLVSKSHHRAFFASSLVPLYTLSYDTIDQRKLDKIYDYMLRNGLLNYTSGVPTSLSATGQQWDFPFGWPNLNHVVIDAFRRSISARMQEEAFRLTQKWITGNLRVFTATKYMWEKYNVTGDVPQPGAGGEYNVQQGFGWTNGVVLDLLVKYGDRLQAPSEDAKKSASVSTLSLAIALIIWIRSLNL